jgi:hypothetical protein
MSTTNPIDPLINLDRAAQIEGYLITFFSNVADVELITDLHPRDHLSSDKSFTAIINFGGTDEHGFVALNCSEVLVRHLAASMLGDEGEMDDTYLGDVLGETINILTDSVLKISTGKNCHKISMPAVIRSDTNLLQKLLADTRGYTGAFRHGTSQVLFKVVIRPADCIAATSVFSAQPVAAVHQIHQLFSCPRFDHRFDHLCSLPQSCTMEDRVSSRCNTDTPCH